ncbi:ATP-binding protein [Brevundimonas sp. NIBR11]|uniref:sensor histidine kinase n=1 Tax=Brevundimonas sp. NIBR11 TaxID=3015999 RepID=UPI0022F04E31|nr:ATP-binding protein [Brevundimonas sp. NIBR11]WGM30547.1 Sensor histidine kinase RcsC [Brevundimonas sp. NIBR11]
MAGRRTWKTFRVAVLFVVLAVAGVLAVLAVVGSAIDVHQREKEETLVELRLARALKSVGEDLTANAVWDEAVIRLSGPRDLDWIDHHEGPFFAAQSGHVATTVYDGEGRLLRVSLNGQATGDDPAEPHVVALAPLVADVRAISAARDRTAVAMAAVRIATGVVQVGGRTFLAAASTVVRHTDDGPIRSADPVVASMKPLETMIAPLGPELGLTAAIYRAGAEPHLLGRQTAVAVHGLDDRTLGWIVWTPETPGAAILRQAVPLMLALLAATLLVATLLFRRVADDVRRLGESEQALAAALQKAEAANAAKSRFLSNISHELRTPLNGVLGMAQVIERDLLTPQQQDRMVLLKESGKAQLRLIENLLVAMRLQNEAVTVTPSAFVPDQMLKRAAADYRATAASKGLKFRVEARTPTRRLGDEEQIARLIEPILDNAIRFTSSGSVTVRSRETADDVVIEVVDTGPGMTSEVIDDLFTAFSQGDETSTRAKDGAGLGLSISHGLATLMDGRIEVESAPGKGSLFRVTLPLPAAE